MTSNPPGDRRSSEPGNRPELLAPAGHVEAFLAAVENGADAVYLGLKRLSARATAANFSLDELASLVPFAHKRNVRIYAALNSLVTETERAELPALLNGLAACRVDGVIVQDPGVLYLARRFFPELKLHASTLMAIHNHAGVRQLERMGAERVVLARELTLPEIQSIASKTTVGLEIFVHGALCYSYSGLCMASSFRGGHSGLQGRCVQPCRLRFRQGKADGFFLSCNDVSLIPSIPALKKMPIAALKIEGRMKPADYIAQVVKAYRRVLDAPPEQEDEAVAQAQEWLLRAPSRRLTLGYLGKGYQNEILTPHRSGSSGLWVGTVKDVRDGTVVLTLRHALEPGDRLRPESAEGKEKEAFTVAKIFGPDGKPRSQGRAGETVRLAVRAPVRSGERLFRVGSKPTGLQNPWKRIVEEGSEARQRKAGQPSRVKFSWDWLPVDPATGRAERWLIKVGSTQDLFKAFESSARVVMLSASPSNLEKAARLSLGSGRQQRFVWSLPALILEKDLDYYRAAVGWFVERGFRSWELNNWAHFDFFPDRERLTLIAGARFNIRNHAALAALSEQGCRSAVLSMETTRTELEALATRPAAVEIVVCVHAWPPLFTSRLIPRLQEEKPIVTPKGETYFFRKMGSLALLYADQPMNWFEQIDTLRELGYSSFLLDASDGPHRQSLPVGKLMAAAGRGRLSEPHSLFNWDRRPV